MVITTINMEGFKNSKFAIDGVPREQEETDCLLFYKDSIFSRYLIFLSAPIINNSYPNNYSQFHESLFVNILWGYQYQVLTWKFLSNVLSAIIAKRFRFGLIAPQYRFPIIERKSEPRIRCFTVESGQSKLS